MYDVGTRRTAGIRIIIRTFLVALITSIAVGAAAQAAKPGAQKPGRKTAAPVQLTAEVPAASQTAAENAAVENAPADGAIGPDELTRQLDSIVAPPRFRAEVGAFAIELPSGRILYEKNADLPLAPASNMKLLTTAVALDTFGAEHKLQTRLVRKGDTLALIGAGDPGFGDRKIALKYNREITAAYTAWATALEESGAAGEIRKLVVDDSIFDAQWRHPSWKEKDFQSWYAAPVGGLMFNDSCVDVSIEVEGGGTEPVLVPECSLFEVVNRSTVGRGRPISIGRPLDNWQLIVSGACTKSTAPYCVTVPDPGMFAATVLYDILKAHGCSFAAPPQRKKVTDQGGNLPEGWQPAGTAETDMADILARCNTDSQNLFAEALMKLAGAKATGAPGSWEGGRIAAMQFLRKYDLPTEGIVIDDGSGLSRHNRVTARLLATLLARMRGPSWQAFVSSLAEGGESGTLARRFRGPLKGKVFAKTGYIDRVSTLSGYIQCDDDTWIAFSFIYNNITSTAPAKQAQEKACEILLKAVQGDGPA